MRRLVFASFSDPSDARQAMRGAERVAPSPSRGRARLHQRRIDPMLAVDLSGTRSQAGRELSVGLRFGLAFGLCAALGLTLDLLGAFGDLPLVGLMVAGSLGVAAGTLWVVCAASDDLDAALDEARGELRSGHTLLTVPVEDGDTAPVHELVRGHGGQRLFEA